ncbi:MAG TPA: hypothetical protein VM328_03180 [Fimbriimonadaceae bacterium]|nr:hypothetical protein [Fimbriimonadaceae bacterium]
MAPRSDIALSPRRHHRAREERITGLGLLAPPPIEVQCDTFTGSLGTLFNCVRERTVDLLRVPLLPICEAYFVYLVSKASNEHGHQPDDAARHFLDEAAAALTALAYLLERKAWLLLPTPDPEPEEVESLLSLPPSTQEYHAAIQSLRVWQEEREQLFFRPLEAGPNPYELPMELGSVSISDLARALERVLERATPEPLDPLTRPRRSLSEQMVEVLRALGSQWSSLDELISEPLTRAEIVYWFLALLELIRLGQCEVRLESGDVQFRLAAR